MSETQQQVQNSTGSIRSPEKLEDTFIKMKVNEDNMKQSSPYPDRPGERDCQFFLRTGQCGYGNSCRYNHPLPYLPQSVVYYKDQLPERIGQPDCEYFLKTGACKYGPTCKYHHPKDRNGAGPVLFNVLGFPMRHGEKSCPYYMQTGSCRFGVACKFHHPHPEPSNGHSAYSMSSFPSVGFPYTSGMIMMPLLPTTYGAMSHPQVPQSETYMPFMLPPSQGILPPQGWPTYMAASNPYYDMKTQPDFSSTATLPVAMTPHHQSFSGRAECRFFMNTGTCKYGDDCKYIHPKERLLQSPPDLLNSIVLPVRPGQPACDSFKTYGFCKFGASCRFDHSMPLSPYDNTGLAISSLHTPYAPPIPTNLKLSLPPNQSESTILSNGEPAAKSQSAKTEKQEDGLAKSHNAETEKQDDGPAQANKPETDDSLPPSYSDSTILSNGETDAKNPSSETQKQADNLEQPNNSKVQNSPDKST